ncbi:MAG: HAMP domain-containing histidine kinase [Bacteroidales bacterium]|jgi:signal transduction histidine kinase|nr:HAMP domain-containing histidine kinase [Bacteroidales bacterium]MDD4087397.1 HAMP domain-containing sensor histidine kinase [Bacteroidales bacterium]
MKPISYKNRIASNYIGATASLILFVFALIYCIIEASIYHNIDRQLHTACIKHTQEVTIENGKIRFINKSEWEEREHLEADVTPLFIEVRDKNGKLCDKSPNLKSESLSFDYEKTRQKAYNTRLNNQLIRAKILPIIHNYTVEGYIVAALPIAGQLQTLHILRTILLTSFPFLLIVLYFIARYLAGKSIQPVNIITRKARTIQRDSLNQRIPIPVRKDELYELVMAINDLLDRIENSMQREKQFTADAAHQLKTPLAVLKGTLEVLVRKNRSEQEYKQTIQETVLEINRMGTIVDQLLLLARFDSTHYTQQQTVVSLVSLMDDIIQRFSQQINEKNLVINFVPEQNLDLQTDPFLIDIIFENLISNAIKYSPVGGTVEIELPDDENDFIFSIKDEGIGIDPEEQQKIFNPFYRSQQAINTRERGDGLGLSIVQKACELLGFQLFIESKPNKGTQISIRFDKSV